MFLLVEPGEFQMGSNVGSNDEKPVHTVRVTQPFYMAETETTQAQWRAVMGSDPSFFKGDDLPVEQVSWNDIDAFMAALNGKGNALPFRLPTEAEWEYCCRAGTTTEFSFGPTVSTDQANYNGNFTYGDGKKGVYLEKTTRVGSFPANTWGFKDMHGNLWEWCADWYAEGYYKECGDPAVDPLGSDAGTSRVVRGGSWFGGPDRLRSALRFRSEPASGSKYDGFRCVRALSRQR